MKTRITALFPAALFCIAMSACTTQSRLPVQYATMKLIEREAVTADEVVEKVSRVRGLLTDGVTLDDLGVRVREAIGYTKLPPSDRLLVDAIIGDVATRLDVGFDAPIGAERRAQIEEALDWINQAARLYQ